MKKYRKLLEVLENEGGCFLNGEQAAYLKNIVEESLDLVFALDHYIDDTQDNDIHPLLRKPFEHQRTVLMELLMKGLPNERTSGDR